MKKININELLASSFNFHDKFYFIFSFLVQVIILSHHHRIINHLSLSRHNLLNLNLNLNRLINHHLRIHLLRLVSFLLYRIYQGFIILVS